MVKSKSWVLTYVLVNKAVKPTTTVCAVMVQLTCKRRHTAPCMFQICPVSHWLKPGTDDGCQIWGDKEQRRGEVELLSRTKLVIYITQLWSRKWIILQVLELKWMFRPNLRTCCVGLHLCAAAFTCWFGTWAAAKLPLCCLSLLEARRRHSEWWSETNRKEWWETAHLFTSALKERIQSNCNWPNNLCVYGFSFRLMQLILFSRYRETENKSYSWY